MASHYDAKAEPTIWRMPDALWADCRAPLPPEKPPGTRGRPVVPFLLAGPNRARTIASSMWFSGARELIYAPIRGVAPRSMTQLYLTLPYVPTKTV